MNWIPLHSKEQVETILTNSASKPCVIFKHSTRCSISSMALSRLESGWKFEDVDAYFLDLIANRELSNFVASRLGVHHESPQLIFIKNGEVQFDASHLDITIEEIAEFV